jgi:CheY-like chemotaxis protein
MTAARSAAQLPPAPAEPETHRSLDVLVADDHELSQMLMCGLLSSLGHRVEGVRNGRDAVAAVQSRPYDLVLMDMNMPEMDGMTATRVIRALTGPANVTPIVALTAHIFVGLREELLAAGMNDYLSKPIRIAALVTALAHWEQRDGQSVV